MVFVILIFHYWHVFSSSFRLIFSYIYINYLFLPSPHHYYHIIITIFQLPLSF